ncbi:hypothetical protein [Novosphingopyxis sp.]|uniref:hypothetical protein n=1 Tax=Novosphingopyxis sp. TaxID=2709690 RepID=UPI003B59310B
MPPLSSTTISDTRRFGSMLLALHSPAGQLFWMTIAAFALRLWTFGATGTQDEQFYLQVGGAMWDGALPFVDIWDRKPIGLFLIYAAAHLLGSSTLAAQIMASACAALTAFLAIRLARHAGARRAAPLAGIAYLLYTCALGGEGGQSPLFYNLPVTAAALLALKAIEDPAAPPRRLLLLGLGAMVLCGLAIQIKYTAMFEGVFLGLTLMHATRRNGRPQGQTLRWGAAWASAGLAPTMLALAVYAALGHGEAFVYANFLSIFGRSEPLGWALGRLAGIGAILSPLILCAVIACRRRSNHPSRDFLRNWAIAAVTGFLVFGGYYVHYALPLVAPLAIAAAPAFEGRGRTALASLALAPAVVVAIGGIASADNRSTRDLDAIVQHTGVGPGACLFVYEGPTRLYNIDDACRPTAFVFPSHLDNRKEMNALPVDPLAETRRILAARPQAIVIAAKPRPGVTNMATRDAVLQSLRRHYRLTGSASWDGKSYHVYRLK